MNKKLDTQPIADLMDRMLKRLSEIEKRPLDHFVFCPDCEEVYEHDELIWRHTYSGTEYSLCPKCQSEKLEDL